MHELAPQVLMDAAITGTGVSTTVIRGGRPFKERCLPFEWRTDPNEACQTSRPLNFQRVRRVDRRVVQRAFSTAKRKVALEDLRDDSAEFQSLSYLKHTGSEWLDSVTLIETIRLAIDEDTPGRYVATSGNKLLRDIPYESTATPADFLHWQPRQAGFWGKGVCEIILPQQCALNYLDMKIGAMLDLGSNVRLFTFGGTLSSGEAFDNEPVKVHELNGPNERPILFSPNVVPTELFQHRQEIIRVGLEVVGVSETRVASKKPAGVVSAVGQREANDIADNRQKPKMVRYERYHIDAARSLAEAKDTLLEAGIDKPVGVETKRGRQSIYDQVRWKDARLSPGQARLTTDSASSLPLQSAARQEVLQEWFGAGLINRTEFMHLNNMPDIEAFASLELADYELILDYIDTIFEDGEQTYPNPTDNLELTKQLMVKASNRFRRLKAPQERLDMLDVHIALADQLAQSAAPANTQQAPAQAAQASQEQILQGQAQAGVPLQ